MSWFNPDAIRGDFEQALAESFDPLPYDSFVAYPGNSLVQFNSLIYRASSQVSGASPPNAPWVEIGPTMKLIYENVESSFNVNGGIRISISWRETRNESIGCNSGSLRSIDGTVSFWIFTPRNVGTSRALRCAMRLRELLNDWRSVSDCGSQVRVYAVNGPRTYDLPSGSDFHAHLVTCSLLAMERVPSFYVEPPVGAPLVTLSGESLTTLGGRPLVTL